MRLIVSSILTPESFLHLASVNVDAIIDINLQSRFMDDHEAPH